MSKKIKIISVFGTRPEAIKFAPVIKELRSKEFISKICITGQHREMLNQVLDLFSLKPDYDLKVMKNNQSLSQVTSKILSGLSFVFMKEKPDMILVQGDTNSSFAAALAAYYMRIPIGHIEAGLRTGDLFQPFPEEGNRILISRLASLNFAPTKLNYNNLVLEGISKSKIFLTGNTVIDSLLYTLDQNSRKKESYWRKKFENIFNVIGSGKPIILVTGHRRENFGKGFLNITKAIKEIAKIYPAVQIIYPVHLNPNVQIPVYGILNKVSNVYLIKPLDYESFIYLMAKSYLILTDSGGVQEEAPSLGKPVIVMREKTERIEAVEAGTVIVSGADSSKIVRSVCRLMDDRNFYRSINKRKNPYGDGKAAERITEEIYKLFRS